MTEYELGNVLWKETKKKKIDFRLAAQTFSEVLAELKKINIDDIGAILTIALERNLTFYDASYAYIAETDDLTLVTEDLELIRKCKRATNIKGIDKL